MFETRRERGRQALPIFPGTSEPSPWAPIPTGSRIHIRAWLCPSPCSCGQWFPVFNQLSSVSMACICKSGEATMPLTKYYQMHFMILSSPLSPPDRPCILCIELEPISSRDVAIQSRPPAVIWEVVSLFSDSSLQARAINTVASIRLRHPLLRSYGKRVRIGW